ncbi:MAG TPA: phage tail protein [Anaerolineales bacterium]
MDRDEILRLLPEVYRRTSNLNKPPGEKPPAVLDAFLGVMERMHAPVEHVLAHLDEYFDPRRASDDFIPFLSTWVDMDALLIEGVRTPEGLYWLRNLILSAAALSKERGTPQGLEQFLQLATGLPGFRVTPDQVKKVRPFHIIVEYPPEASSYLDWIRKIIDWEKPAYVTFDLCPVAGSSAKTAGECGQPVDQPAKPGSAPRGSDS